MGEYVEISSSPGEIIRIADALGERGRALALAAGTINNAITEREGRSETLQPDQFTEPFLVNYHASATGVDGKSTTANDAVRQSAVYCGNKLAEIGETVNIAMTNYEATDDESGDSIARTV
jgi:hypothetical protein